ncbi:MAG: hypothetical protein BHW09_00110 [Clostridium sp. CAG:245_30_32]|nr:MAG: hypothetical protein BHW09_00110 [Clostridium sp. CAG:245_30_32]
MKLLVIIILTLELICLPKSFFIDIFVIFNEFVINEIIMKGEDIVKKLMKSKKASSILFYMEMFG